MGYYYSNKITNSMSLDDSPDRKKLMLKMSPFTGYSFKEDVIGNYRSAHGILTAHHDDPFENIALSKMRNNLHCLSNPDHFDSVKDGRISFQKNHNVILKDPKNPKLQNRMKSVRL